MNIPYIPVCGACFADLETCEKDDNGNVICWICPECGEITYANEFFNTEGLFTREEDVRKSIVDKLLANPVLGENYVDWHTEDGKCGLTIMFPNQRFDIIIQKK